MFHFILLVLKNERQRQSMTLPLWKLYFILGREDNKYVINGILPSSDECYEETKPGCLQLRFKEGFM